ncbi:ABC transporter permease [candidate division KSB1 bacterium]|nr:ABC transporter permease [candidate division KSB1 bacterium]
MFKNYLKIALRNLLKHKGYSFINIFGLAVGLTCCILILLFVQDELSFDRFHRNAGRLYRLNKVFTPQTGGSELHAISSGQMGPAMVQDYPEVEQCVRLLPWFDDVLMTHSETTLKISDVVIADSTFLAVFDFKLLHGDAKTALTRPLSIVLSEQTARKFFGDVVPLGETILGFREQLYTITGVIADAPANSHLRYNALISWSSTVAGVGPLQMPWLNNWLTQVAYTYLLLKPGADAAALQQKFPDFMQRHFAEKADQYRLYLQPFNEIYLKSGNILFTRSLRMGNATYVYVFAAIAVLILLIACTNFMNLATARAAQRAKEVGVRKVLGADRRQLARQFLGESTMFSLLAMIIAITSVELLLPAFNAFAGKNLQLDLANNLALACGLPLLNLIVGFISGTYPAFLLSKFHAARVLKGVWTGAPSTSRPRKILVTAQFAIAIALIAGTGVIYQQVEFTQKKNLGFEKEQIVVLPIGNTQIAKKFEAFKNELLQHSNIIAAAGSNSVPGEDMMSFGIRPEGKPETEDWVVSTIRIDDFDLLKTYGMSMAAGRYFSPDFPTDATHGIVINESLAKSLGWKDPIGKKLDVSGEVADGRVIGVIKDFHTRSLHFPIEPMLLYFAPRHGNLAVRIAAQEIPATIDFLRQTWQRFDARYPFEYYFLDERFAQLYASEQRLMQTFGLFSILAVLVAGLGLLGLTSYAAEQRTREIGVRKVLGASIAGIVALLSKDFLKLVLIAFAVASPIAYFAMNRWLQDFAYRIQIGVETFVLAGVLALMIAWLTVSYQSIKAALANPAEALRYE